MIERLKTYLKKKYDYELTDYAVFKPPYTVGVPMILSFGVFVILTAIMGYGMVNDVKTFMNFPIFVFALFVLVLVPLALRSTNRHYAIIVTPRFLIQRCGKREYTVVTYNNVTSFELHKDGVHIKEGNEKILLSVNLFKEEIDPIIDILEAKGKTFDPKKEFLIRPIEIIIKDNKVTVADPEEEAATNSPLYDKYVSLYPALTPGFLDQLTFRNAMIEKTTIEEKNVIINLSSLIVREDHPENTSFGQMRASKCVVIIENINVKDVVIEDYDGLGKTDLIEMLVASNDASTVTQIKYGIKEVEVDLTIGVQACKIVFGYDDVFVGWKDIVKL